MFENSESGLLTDDGEYIVENDAETQRAEALTNIIASEPEPEQINKWALRGRLRSKTMWAAAVGVIIVVFSAFNVWEKIGITVEGFREIAAAVGALLAEFGVFNDPTNRDGF